MTKRRTKAIIETLESTNSFNSLLLFCALYSVSTGIYATDNAPSPNILLKKFGILNATKKESRAP